MVYSEAKDFSALWKRYLVYLPKVKLPYPWLSGPIEKETGFSETKLASISYTREEKETTVHHIFVNMNPK
ncbi:MAG: hypothetical protein GY757_01250 [bacterium]|nr:hypothetical protein [bacterium]